MTCGNPFKHKIQKVINNFLDIFSVEEKITDELKWNVCNLVFAIMLQKNLRRFPIFISKYF